MAYRIIQAETSDIPNLVRVIDAAFRDDPVIGLLMPDIDPKVKFEHDCQWYEKMYRQKELTGLRFRKVVDETGNIVAFARWKYPYTLTAEQKAEKEKQDLARLDCPKGANEALYKEFFGRLDVLKEKYFNDGVDYFLHLLVVHPSYQRQGLGSLLIREGLAAADRDIARTYIEASPAGLELYKRHGWVQVDEIVLDMSLYGGHGMANERVMMREPGVGI